MKSLTFAALVSFVVAGVFVAASPVLAADLKPSDYVEIEQLYAQYNIAIDGGDAEAYANTFTPDGVFNSFAGHEALIAFARNWREKMNGANRRHWNTNLRLVGTAEGAKGSVYLLLLDVGTKPVSVVSTGRYSDVLVKTSKGWRFKQRTTTRDEPAAAAPVATSNADPAAR